MKQLTLILLFLILLPSTFGNEVGRTKKKLLNPYNLKNFNKQDKSPKLYDIEEDTVIQVENGKLLPHRIYTVYLEEKKAWFFAKTNSRGKFVEPKEIIHANSVFSGEFLGAKNTSVNYKLSPDWKWVVTKAKEEYFFWVLSQPQTIKHVTFEFPKVSKK